ncbi:MAG: pilus assembly protein [Spiribacter sp.]|jgi:hypothetical protein|nr:pilus assembly protein [Spiribacter sp.]
MHPRTAAAAAKPIHQNTGNVMLETLIALPVVLVLGLSVAQWALVHQARAVVDHATLMAARAGAVNHAEMAPMRNAFARALVSLKTPKQTARGFESAFFTKALPDSRVHMRLRLLNPTQEAFADHARVDYQSRRYLPYRDLRRAPSRIGRQSQISVQDAGLLSVQATYGYPLNMPFAGAFILQAVQLATRFTRHYDARERVMLASSRLPIITTATIRMQSRLYQSRHLPNRADLVRHNNQ